MTSTTSLPFDSKERTAQLVWTLFILMFFLIQAVIWTVAISLTAGDRSHAVVADYQSQSMYWDDFKKLKQASTALGWQADIEISDQQDIRKNRRVTIRLTDSNGETIDNADISMKVFHLARAADVTEVSFTPMAPGEYASIIRFDYEGSWQLKGTAKLASQLFLIDERVFVSQERN